MSSDRLSPISNRAGDVRTRPTALLIGLTLAAMLLGLAPGSLEAGFVLEVNSTSTTAGGSGSFDLVLINTSGSFQVSGFSVELSVAANSGVTFTGVTTNTTTAPYLFGTLQSPPFSFSSFPGTDFTASDSDMTSPGYVSPATGQIFGLEHVSFAVAPGTVAGPVPIKILLGDTTQLLDLNANLLPFSTTNGTISVTSATVPEPPSLVALVMGVVSVSIAVRLRALLGSRAL